jgi:RNA polymerase sigma factor (sigma-70 family)
MPPHEENEPVSTTTLLPPLHTRAAHSQPGAPVLVHDTEVDGASRPILATPTDSQLLDAAKSGGSAAIEELFRRYHPVALRIASRYATDDYPRQDLAADAMAAMVNAFSYGGGPRTAVGSYLAVTIRNLAATRARRRSHAAHAHTVDSDAFADLSLVDDAHQPERRLIEAETRRELAAAMGTLQPRARQILRMLVIDGLTVTECATELGMSSEAVRALSYRARRALRASYLEQRHEFADRA